MHKWANVAKIIKVKTSEGGLVVRSTKGLPFLLSEGMQVSFVPPQFDCPRNARVESLVELSDDSYQVDFDVISDRQTGERLVNCFCIIPRSYLPDDNDERNKPIWLGYEVLDETYGQIGVLIDRIENKAQTLLYIEGSYGPVYLPDVEEFVLSVDNSLRQIRTRVPKGLIELNSEEGKR